MCVFSLYIRGHTLLYPLGNGDHRFCGGSLTCWCIVTSGPVVVYCGGSVLPCKQQSLRTTIYAPSQTKWGCPLTSRHFFIFKMPFRSLLSLLSYERATSEQYKSISDCSFTFFHSLRNCFMLRGLYFIVYET